jgi:hypothetical protein
MESMDNVRERFEALEQQMKVMGAHTRTVERRLRWWRGIACGVMLLGLVSLPLQSGKTVDAQEQGLPARVTALENKLVAVTFDSASNKLTITRANLHVVNGLGATNTTNGLGNLIVGYNELRSDGTDRRTGSHNVVVGSLHNFSSFGGLVAGHGNEISAMFASVTGGQGNIASGWFSSISGGNANTADGVSASISGGLGNTASGTLASISGGHDNRASGDLASVSGGLDNRAIGLHSWVTGGFFNTASGEQSSASGGQANTASGFGSSVSGGEHNTASGDFSSVSGGNGRAAPATDNWAAGTFFAPN